MLKKINFLTNHDLALLVQWFEANKVSLNTSKTEIVVFRPKHKIITKHLNFRMRGEKINLSSTVKYPTRALRMARTYKLSTNKTKQGSWSAIQNTGLCPKIFLRAIYFLIFNSHLINTCQIWRQKENTIKKLSEVIQDKAIHIVNFKDKSYPAN